MLVTMNVREVICALRVTVKQPTHGLVLSVAQIFKLTLLSQPYLHLHGWRHSL